MEWKLKWYHIVFIYILLHEIQLGKLKNIYEAKRGCTSHNFVSHWQFCTISPSMNQIILEMSGLLFFQYF